MKNNRSLDLNSLFFHSLGDFREVFKDRNQLKKLDSILRCGKILSRENQLRECGNNAELTSLLDKYNQAEFSYNWNEMSHISICQKCSLRNSKEDSEAFKDYVKGNVQIGIILSRDVAYLIDKARGKTMDGEFQIPNEIPLTFMKGIFCGGKSYQELLQEIKFAQDYGISSAEIKNAIPHVLIANQQEVYQAIYGLLFKYGYDVPIISSRDGNEIVDVGQIYKTVEDEYEN